MTRFYSQLFRIQPLQRTIIFLTGVTFGGNAEFLLSDPFGSIPLHRIGSLNAPTPSASSKVAQQPTNTIYGIRKPRLDGKVAIVTGASRGLGKSIAIRFVEEGSRVVLLDIADCNETLAELAACSNCRVEKVAMAIRCDISKEAEVIESLRQASAYFGPNFDVLVNNACAFVFRSVEEATMEDWIKSMQVSIIGHALVTKHCLPYMRHAIGGKSGHGPSIIFLGSISSFRAQPGCATYATMKGAIVQMARNCAFDFAKYNIRVNSICPGTIETPISAMERKEHGWNYDEWEDLKTQDVILGRVGTPLEVANAALFYASNESTYCSGSHLMIDGGAAACTIMEK